MELERIREVLRRRAPSPDIREGRSAAVALLFRRRDEALEFLLIKRADRQGDPWSGHMALPGGRRDPGDADLFETAVRETLEEVGVDLRHNALLLGALDDEDATGRGSDRALMLRPFVFEVAPEIEAGLSDEVSAVFWVPLERLVRAETQTEHAVEYKGTRYLLPAWEVDGNIVWGLTYRMIRSLLAELER